MAVNEIVVVHPFGLGDHLICNGLINSLCDDFSKIWLPVMAVPPHNNIATISGLYSDNQKIGVLPLNRFLHHWEPLTSFQATYEQFNVPILELSMFKNRPDDCIWYEWFYRQTNVPYNFRTTKFHIPNKFLDDWSLYNEIIPSKNYVLVHNSWSTFSNYPFDWNRCDSHDETLEKVFLNPNHRHNLLDWSRIILEAEEIHVTPSSLFLLVWHLGNKVNARKYFHDVRNTQETVSHEELINLGWNVIDYSIKY